MNNFLKITGFGLSLILFYTLFAVYYVPDPNIGARGKRGQRVVLPIEEVGPVAYGEEVYYGRGGCAGCHDAAGDRAPELTYVALNASSRIALPGYAGEATDAVGYLYESMVRPSAYVVDGYGTLAGKRVVSPMPDVSAGSIRLNKVELAAAIAYLQAVAGLEVTVEIPGASGKPDAEDKMLLPGASGVSAVRE